MVMVNTISDNFFSFQDKLLNKLEESEPELATTQEEEVRLHNIFVILFII